MNRSLRRRLGALAYDWPRFLRHIWGDWTLIRNRAEKITSNGKGVLCHWEYGSDLHIANVYAIAARWLMRRALATFPITCRDEPHPHDAPPEVSFLIGHRGVERLPLLLATLRSLAGQRHVPIECVVVEQSKHQEIDTALPGWVRYLHTPVDAGRDYCRAATFNSGARVARGRVLVFHDNDMLVPDCYAACVAGLGGEGWKFMDLKRFIFYLDEPDTGTVLARGAVNSGFAGRIVQNLHGGSVAATRSDYFEIGGFDEEYVGWGGEDLDFWDRATHHGSAYGFGFLPFVHLWHPAQRGKLEGDSPAIRRYAAMREIPPVERIERLRAQRLP